MLPIVLLHRGSIASDVVSKLGSGWDVVVPARWSMPVWLALKAAGARPIGLREQLHQQFEEGVPSFPLDYVDTASYRADALQRQAELQAAFDRRPPAKRPNYAKLAVPHPFLPDWSSLLLPDDDARTAVVPLRPPWYRRSGDVAYVQLHMQSGRAKLHAQVYPCSAADAERWRSQIRLFDAAEQPRPLGFVTTAGEWSYARGYGFGLAVVSRAVLDARPPLVFVRNPTSQHCHLATVVPLRSFLL